MRKHLIAAVALALLASGVVVSQVQARGGGGGGHGGGGHGGGHGGGYGYGHGGYGYGHGGYGYGHGGYGYGHGGGWYGGYGGYGGFYGGGYYGGLYRGGWYGSGYSPYWSNYYAQPVVGYQSNYPPVQDAAPGFRMRILVPTENAQVWISDAPTQQRGLVRIFDSPPLEPGSYTYAIRARWRENGRDMDRTQTIHFHPGDSMTVDFRQPQEETLPAP